MTAEELAGHVASLERAAEVVEAIDDEDLQRRHGWDLAGWRYELVPWGVRFARRERRGADDTEVIVLAVMRRPGPSGGESARAHGLCVVLSGG